MPPRNARWLDLLIATAVLLPTVSAFVPLVVSKPTTITTPRWRPSTTTASPTTLKPIAPSIAQQSVTRHTTGSVCLAAASAQSWMYMTLLAGQFATQPLLTQKYAPQGLIRATYVVVQEVIRIVLCASLLTLTGSFRAATVGWNVRGALQAASVPATLYVIQNYCSLVAYQTLSPLTYNVLNQLKTVSAAIWCFVLLQSRQSPLQMVALALLVVAAIVMEWHKLDDTHARHTSSSSVGLIAILIANFTSGLAGAWTQRALMTGGGRNSLLLSMELSVCSLAILLVTLASNLTNDSKRMRQEGIWSKWKATTFLPVLTNAGGGILVGLVTKHAGAVPKGFALIVGVAVSGVLQQVWQQQPVSLQQWVGGALAGVSLWMHAQFPIATAVTR